jgi:hypothetical protein
MDKQRRNRRREYIKMPCRECMERRKDWEGDDPKCAFETSVFDPKNWNCATMNKLRSIASAFDPDSLPAYQSFGWSTRFCDISLAVITVSESDNYGERFVVLSWYKERGRTGQAWVFCEDAEPERLTLEMAEIVIKQNRATLALQTQLKGDSDE